MVAELEKPTVELRKNILRNKIHRDGLQFPQEVIAYGVDDFIDSHCLAFAVHYLADDTLRQFQVYFFIVYGGMRHNGNDDALQVTYTVAHVLCKVVNSESKAVTVDEIINTVCKHFGLETATIHTKSRKREVVQARQIAMYLAKNYTDFSTAKIGASVPGLFLYCIWWNGG